MNSLLPVKREDEVANSLNGQDQQTQLHPPTSISLDAYIQQASHLSLSVGYPFQQPGSSSSSAAQQVQDIGDLPMTSMERRPRRARPSELNGQTRVKRPMK